MVVKVNQDEFYQYITDQANLMGACDKVFIVKNSKEVVDVVLKANELKIPLTVCGNHTSLTGASLPESGWVISTEGLDQILEINQNELFVVIQPGITLHQLQLVLVPLGLFFPPDPTEDTCFLGGMIGTNASGARSFNFGSTRNFIEALEVVLPTGEEIFVSRKEKIVDNKFILNIKNRNPIEFDIPDTYVLPEVKNVAGYFLKPEMNPMDLFIGSEGTLGIVTSAKLKLKRLPKDYISMVIFFQETDNCFKFIEKLRIECKAFAFSNHHICTDVIEYYDKNSLVLLLDRFPDIPKQANAALWLEYGVDDISFYDKLLNSWERFLVNEGIDTSFIWFGADNSDRAKIKDMRHALPVIINEIIKKRGVRKLGTDIAVPHHFFKDFYNMAIRATEDKKLQYVVFGHFGDSHMHLNILPANQDEMQIGKALYTYLCTVAIKLGGTFSAEHGVGKLKCDYLKLMIGGTNFQYMRDVKLSFDPNNILGRDTLFKLTNLSQLSNL